MANSENIKFKKSLKKAELIETILEGKEKNYPFSYKENEKQIKEEKRVVCWQLDKKKNIFDLIPKYVLIKILIFLPISQIPNLALTSKRFRQLIDNQFWKEIYRGLHPQHFQLLETQSPPSTNQTKKRKREEEQEKKQIDLPSLNPTLIQLVKLYESEVMNWRKWCYRRLEALSLVSPFAVKIDRINSLLVFAVLNMRNNVDDKVFEKSLRLIHIGVLKEISEKLELGEIKKLNQLIKEISKKLKKLDSIESITNILF